MRHFILTIILLFLTGCDSWYWTGESIKHIDRADTKWLKSIQGTSFKIEVSCLNKTAIEIITPLTTHTSLRVKFDEGYVFHIETKEDGPRKRSTLKNGQWFSKRLENSQNITFELTHNFNRDATHSETFTIQGFSNRFKEYCVKL